MCCTKIRPEFHLRLVIRVFLRWSDLRIHIPKSVSWNIEKVFITTSPYPHRLGSICWCIRSLECCFNIKHNLLTNLCIILELKTHNYKSNRLNLTVIETGLLPSKYMFSVVNPRKTFGAVDWEESGE